jgi:hypothetical protein
MCTQCRQQQLVSRAQPQICRRQRRRILTPASMLLLVSAHAARLRATPSPHAPQYCTALAPARRSYLHAQLQWQHRDMHLIEKARR